MPIRSYVPIAVAMLSAAGLSVAAARVAVDRIETGARLGLVRVLAEGGHSWARVDVDGLQVRLSGTAPDETTRFAALSAAGTIVDATRVIDDMETKPAQEIEAPEFKIELLRNLDGISLIGLVPAGYDRSLIFDRIGRMANGAVTDLLEEGSYPTPTGWTPAVRYALDALERIPRSKISVSATQISVTGIVDSEQVRRRIETELARRAPPGVDLTLDISAPRPVIAPYTLRFIANGETRRFDACAAETPEARDAILAVARELGVAENTRCQIGLGAPSLDWPAAVALGLRTLDILGAGTITYTDADVSLVVPHDIEPSAFDRAAGRLEAGLPAGFSLTAVQTPPPEDTASDTADRTRVPEFIATLDADGQVELSGRLASERTRTAVEAYAHAHFGPDHVTLATRLDDSLPAGWSLRAIAGVDALAHLGQGQVRVRPDKLEITGETGIEDAAARISGLLAERLGTGAVYEISISYVEALDPTLDIPTPAECVEDLNTVLAVQKLSFEPGSATLDAPSLQIIDQLAEILKTCQDVPIEIAGHTDSQGRESMNLNLSQERADAVLNAILARRVLTTNLSAQGYGETVPIADNGTEEGREANRRIEFTLLAVDEESTDEETAETAEESESEQN